jgi:hypothetical protein
MEYETRTYFTEHEEESVKGFTIIGSCDGEYHIAEKWIASNGGGPDSKWVSYYVPEAQLNSRVTDGSCEPKAQLTDEQFASVCQKIDHSEVTAEALA